MVYLSIVKFLSSYGHFSYAYSGKNKLFMLALTILCIITKKGFNMSAKPFPVHKECANFENGFCTAYDITVNPNDPACPNFTPKTTKQTHAISTPLPIPYQTGPPITYRGTAMPPLQIAGNSPPPPQTGRRMRRYRMSGRGGGRGRSGGGRGGGRGAGGGGRGRGRMNGRFAAGPGGSCVCPNCGYIAPHSVGTPCYQQTCPKCGTKMTRKT